MPSPNKVRYRDLAPELQALLSGGDVKEGALAQLLEKYRKKTDVITESDLDDAYKRALNIRISDIREQLERLEGNVGVISEDRLSAQFLQRIKDIELQVDALKGAKDFTSDIQSLQQAFSDLKAAVEKSGVTALDDRFKAIDDSVSELQEEIANLKTVDTEIKRQISALSAALNNKRSKDALIGSSDLTSELLGKITKGVAAYDTANGMSKTAGTFPGVKPGKFLGVDNELGLVDGKVLFWEACVVENDSDAESAQSIAAGLPIVVMSTGKYYDLAMQENAANYVLVEDYFKNAPKVWNTFIVDSRDKSIAAYVLDDGTMIRLSSSGAITKKLTLAKGENKTLPRVNALMRRPVEVLVKDPSVDSKYVSAIAVVDIGYDTNSYTLYNQADTALELIVME